MQQTIDQKPVFGGTRGVLSKGKKSVNCIQIAPLGYRIKGKKGKEKKTKIQKQLVNYDFPVWFLHRMMNKCTKILKNCNYFSTFFLL